jgi:hypothetical protein
MNSRGSGSGSGSGSAQRILSGRDFGPPSGPEGVIVILYFAIIDTLLVYQGRWCSLN